VDTPGVSSSFANGRHRQPLVDLKPQFPKPGGRCGIPSARVSPPGPQPSTAAASSPSSISPGVPTWAAAPYRRRFVSFSSSALMPCHICRCASSALVAQPVEGLPVHALRLRENRFRQALGTAQAPPYLLRLPQLPVHLVFPLAVVREIIAVPAHEVLARRDQFALTRPRSLVQMNVVDIG